MSSLFPLGDIFALLCDQLQINAKKLLRKYAYHEGYHGDTHADDQHLEEARQEFLIRGNRDIVGEGGDDHHDDGEHTEECRQGLRRAEEYVRQDQQHYGDEIGDARV